MAEKNKINPAKPQPYGSTTAPLQPRPTFHLSEEIKEEGVFTSLISSVRDIFFPEKLPPLVLESTPIAVPDRMATKMSRESIALSIGFYVLLFLLLLLLIKNHVQLIKEHAPTLISLNAPPPPVAPAAQRMGGGGGAHDVAPVTKGAPPKLAQTQIVPPKAPPTIPPKLAVEPTVVVQPDLKIATNNMPNLGMPNAPNAAIGSLGTGSGGGIGSGNGNGIGPGSGGNMGGGVYKIGGGVRPPQLTYQVDAEFSEEARKAKFSGNVMVDLIVDENGNPSHIKVARGVGMGLDEKAVEAVRQYKFKPATKDGKPVKVEVTIDVNFQIFKEPLIKPYFEGAGLQPRRRRPVNIGL
jgi:protein TonB